MKKTFIWKETQVLIEGIGFCGGGLHYVVPDHFFVSLIPSKIFWVRAKSLLSSREKQTVVVALLLGRTCAVQLLIAPGIKKANPRCGSTF